MSHGPCEACEELLQGYLDRELTDAEVELASLTSTAATTAVGGTASRCRSASTCRRPPPSGCLPA